MTCMSNVLSPVAPKVRGIAAEKGISQDGIAKIIGISRTAVSKRLNGKGDFTATELKRLAEAFDVKVGAFFGEVAA